MSDVQRSPVGADPYVLAVDHVGIAVPDLDAAKEWYATHLGMTAYHEEVNEEQGVREAMLSVGPPPPGDDGAAPALPEGQHAASGGDGATVIQLLAPLRPDSPIGRFLDRSGPGIQQLAYRVRDLDGLSDRLRQQGVRLLYDAPRGGTAGSRVNFIHPKDAGGVLVELVEPSPKPLQPPS